MYMYSHRQKATLKQLFLHDDLIPRGYLNASEAGEMNSGIPMSNEKINEESV